MKINIDITTAKNYPCLEPDVGEELLPFYPDILSPKDKALFEGHMQYCQACQERVKLQQIMGHLFRTHALTEQAKHLLEQRRYADAIVRYNQALQLEPTLVDTQDGQEFFLDTRWVSLTGAYSEQKDLMPYLSLEHSPQTYALSASGVHMLFPLSVEYEHGKVKGRISSAGHSVFFELDSATDEFQRGITLIGRILHPAPTVKIWSILPGKPQKLGTIHALFGSVEFTPDAQQTLRTFKLLPM